MTIDFEDDAMRCVTGSDVRHALVAVTRLLLDPKLVGLLPVQVQSELPNVRRCILELHALRAARGILEQVALRARAAPAVDEATAMGRRASAPKRARAKSVGTARATPVSRGAGDSVSGDRKSVV